MRQVITFQILHPLYIIVCVLLRLQQGVVPVVGCFTLQWFNFNNCVWRTSTYE